MNFVNIITKIQIILILKWYLAERGQLYDKYKQMTLDRPSQLRLRVLSSPQQTNLL